LLTMSCPGRKIVLTILLNSAAGLPFELCPFIFGRRPTFALRFGRRPPSFNLPFYECALLNSQGRCAAAPQDSSIYTDPFKRGQYSGEYSTKLPPACGAPRILRRPAAESAKKKEACGRSKSRGVKDVIAYSCKGLLKSY